MRIDGVEWLVSREWLERRGRLHEARHGFYRLMRRGRADGWRVVVEA